MIGQAAGGWDDNFIAPGQIFCTDLKLKSGRVGGPICARLCFRAVLGAGAEPLRRILAAHANWLTRLGLRSRGRRGGQRCGQARRRRPHALGPILDLGLDFESF